MNSRGLILMTVSGLSLSLVRFITLQRCHSQNVVVQPEEVNHLLEYLRFANTSSCSRLRDLNRVKSNESIVCMDPGLELDPKNCLIYWLGVSVDPLSISGLQQYGCQVYVFTPWSQDWNASQWSNVHPQDIGISFEDTDEDLAYGWKRRTLYSLYQMFKAKHGDSPIDLVVMDVAHAEWLIIPNIIQSGILGRVKQLSVQLNFYEDVQFYEYLRICIKRLQLLEGQGMVRFTSQFSSKQTTIQLGRFNELNTRMFWFNSNLKQ